MWSLLFPLANRDYFAGVDFAAEIAEVFRTGENSSGQSALHFLLGEERDGTVCFRLGWFDDVVIHTPLGNLVVPYLGRPDGGTVQAFIRTS